MYKVSITGKAENDLSEIALYIVNKLQNPSAALALLDEIQERYRNLSENPKMYELCRDSKLRNQGYRRVVIKNYVMVYRVEDATKTVYVMRFFYGARDYEKLL